METILGHDGSSCGSNLASDIELKINEAARNGDLEDKFCEGEIQCNIAMMLGEKSQILVPVVSGLAGAAFVFIGFVLYHGRKNRAHEDTNIEVAFPIPSLPEEDNDPFETEQSNPFDHDQSNPFEQSTDRSFGVSYR